MSESSRIVQIWHLPVDQHKSRVENMNVEGWSNSC